MKFDISDMASKIASMEDKADVAINVFAEAGASKLESYAKNNAKWTDRSGRARGSLRGYVQHRHDKITLVLAHGVDYGIWLELAHEKRFSIIPITIQNVGVNQILPAFHNFLERLG